MSVCVGIDFGSAYCSVAVFKNERPELIVNANGLRATPTVLAFTEDEMLFGDAAYAQAYNNPANTISEVASLIGKTYDEVAEEAKSWPFKVLKGAGGLPEVQVEFKGKTEVFTVVKLLGIVFGGLKKMATAYVGSEVKEAVVAVPMSFSAAQRAVLEEGLTAAGLSLLRVVNEPVVSAIAYDMDVVDLAALSRGNSQTLVVDVGGKTCDATLLSIRGGVIQVASHASVDVGGKSMDKLVVEYVAGVFERKNKVQIKDDVRSMAKLHSACERAKRGLSQSAQANIEVDSLFNGIDLFTSITKARFDGLISDIASKVLDPVKKVLAAEGLVAADVGQVILVGGSSRVNKVQDNIESYFGKSKIQQSINAEDVIAYGAAIEGSLLTGKSKESINKLPNIEAASLSIGIEVADGLMHHVVPVGTPIPCSTTVSFSNEEANQTSVMLQIFQGERPRVKDNIVLGQVLLAGLPAAAIGTLSISATFAVDKDGSLSVTMTEKKSGKSSSVSFAKSKSGSEQVKRHLETAVANKAADNTIIGIKRGLDSLRKEAAAAQAQIKSGELADKNSDIATLCARVETMSLSSTDLGSVATQQAHLVALLSKANAGDEEEESEEENDEDDDESEEESEDEDLD